MLSLSGAAKLLVTLEAVLGGDGGALLPTGDEGGDGSDGIDEEARAACIIGADCAARLGEMALLATSRFGAAAAPVLATLSQRCPGASVFSALSK